MHRFKQRTFGNIIFKAGEGILADIKTNILLLVIYQIFKLILADISN